MSVHVCLAPSDTISSFTQTTSDATGSPNHLPFLRLPHPRTGIPSLFLLSDPSTPSTSKSASTLLEVQAIFPDASRSWFFGDNNIVQDGKLLLLTPIDATFILVPVLMAAVSAAGGVQFRPLEDIFETAIQYMNSVIEEQSQCSETQNPRSLLPDDVLQLARLETFQLAAQNICEFKEITEDIRVYRLCLVKVREYLRTKVDRLSNVAVYDSFKTLTRGLAKDGLGLDLKEQNEELRQAARIRGACDILSQYLPPRILDDLVSSYDFVSLDAYLQSLRDEESAVITARLAAETLVLEKKKANTASAAAAKKGKGKNGPSSGVKQLAKANVQGMSKLNTFFVKKEKA